MTPEELDKARAHEAQRLFWAGNGEGKGSAIIAARLAREGWTPPPPVDPDVVAFRKWMDTNPLKPRPWTEQNRYDNLLCEVFCQGARMAREAEAERAKVLLETLDDIRQSGPHFESGRAHAALAAYNRTTGA